MSIEMLARAQPNCDRMTIRIIERRRRERNFWCLVNGRMLLSFFQVFSRFFEILSIFPGLFQVLSHFQVFPAYSRLYKPCQVIFYQTRSLYLRNTREEETFNQASGSAPDPCESDPASDNTSWNAFFDIIPDGAVSVEQREVQFWL